MTTLKAGDSFPEGVTFTYVPYTPELAGVTACGIPVKYDASKEAKEKKLVIVSVPGAFTPTCQNTHIQGYIEKLPQLKAAGVDQVLVISYNDAWVQAAWAKANGIKDEIIFASDDGAPFSNSIGWTLGARTARYAIVVDHGKVVYAEKEPDKGVTVSGVDAVLAKL
ncbi:putative peroxiredoxin pmp20 [Daldinia childiae]|uniref:putative peroxiredoxin pmp20 n=1 Tax=Daldinia childiae TaxID=326645 RepID=UPI0014462DEF|nr:putative peroxiredoxin pmp20 [Daldinia childiae]KAF3069063.1 putative peroxiredoxin pmp20 [Daldinia childiae]